MYMKKKHILTGLIMIFMFTIMGCENPNNEETSISEYSLCETKISNDKQKEINLAVISGNHANSVGIPLNSTSINNALYNSCYTHGKVSFIRCDGNPKVFYQADIPEPQKKGLSKNKRDSIAENYKDELINELLKSTPEVAEVDTLKAINLASKTLSTSSSSSDNYLIIMDTGVATAGYVDFTKGLLNAEPEDIVQALKAEEALPNLSNISVVFMFCGQTSSPQKELSEKQKRKLQNIWEAILVGSGAKSVTFTNDISSEIPDSAYPQVSLVDVEESYLEDYLSDNDSQVDTFILDSASTSFIGNKAVFVDEALAYQEISVVAQSLLSHPNNKAYVIGTTATGDEEYCKQLSKDRAQLVCSVLKSFGVPENQIIPIGLGYSDPWHINDLDENGYQIEELAYKNRTVRIIDVKGEEAKKL